MSGNQQQEVTSIIFRLSPVVGGLDATACLTIELKGESFFLHHF